MWGSRKVWGIVGGTAIVLAGGGFVAWLVSLGPVQAAPPIHGARHALSASSHPAPTSSGTSQPTTSPTSHAPSLKTSVSLTKTSSVTKRSTASPARSTASPTHTTQSPPPTHSTTSSVPASPAPAQADPSLAATVAQEPVATGSQIQAAIKAGNPQQLGELNWNTADAQAVVQALGSTAAPASTTALYAKTFLYAMLSDNASVFNALPESGGAYGPDGQLSTQGIPFHVSQVDQITLNDVQHGSSSIEYDYSVTYTTTQGTIKTSICSITFNTFNTKQWVLGVVADLGAAPE